MGRRKRLKVQERQEIFDIPADEDSLIRHYSLSAVDRLEIELRRREHNKLGFALQLCLMRYPGRVLAVGEIPPRTMLKYVADQIGVDPTTFTLYSTPRRDAPRPRCPLDDLSQRQDRNSTGSSRGVAIGD